MQVVGCYAWETHCCPTYKGQTREYKGTTIKIHEFWFCPNQIARCVPMFLHDPKSLKFGMFLLAPTLHVLKSLSLKKLGFCLQSRVPISPRRFLSSSRVFQHVLWTHPRPIHAERIPPLRNGTQVCRSCKSPTENHRNQWESARNVNGIITGVNFLPYPGLGVIITHSL